MSWPSIISTDDTHNDGCLQYNYSDHRQGLPRVLARSLRRQKEWQSIMSVDHDHVFSTTPVRSTTLVEEEKAHARIRGTTGTLAILESSHQRGVDQPAVIPLVPPGKLRLTLIGGVESKLGPFVISHEAKHDRTANPGTVWQSSGVVERNVVEASALQLPKVSEMWS